MKFLFLRLITQLWIINQLCEKLELNACKKKKPLVCKSTHWKEVTYIFDQRWGLGMCIVIFLNVICLLFFKRLKGSHTNDVRCLVWYVNQFVESITTALRRTSLSIFNIVKLFDALYRTFVPKSLYSFTGIVIPKCFPCQS